MKLIKLFTALTFFVLLTSCNKPPKDYSHKVELFCREDIGNSDSQIEGNGFEKRLDQLSNEGWEYEGVICSNGINCNYISFRKAK